MSGLRSLSVKRTKDNLVILAYNINGSWDGLKISKE